MDLPPYTAIDGIRREREKERGGSFIPDEKKESYLALVIGWALDSAVVRTRRKGVGR